jgi:hypothetical protein
MIGRGRSAPHARSLSAGRLREMLAYDPETGHFTWRVCRPGGICVGSRAGTDSGVGYILISVDCVRYKAHRLAWLHVYGEWPTKEIDHINLIRDDNRIVNLRQANPSEQTINSRRRSDNTSGFRGVKRHSDGRWEAAITYERKHIYLGLHDTAEQASAAYEAKAKELFGPFYRAHA